MASKISRNGTGKTLCRSFLFVLSLESIPDSLPCASDAFFVCVSVHPQRDRCVTMAESFRHGDNIRTVGDGYACGAVTQLVRMKVLNAVAITKLFEIACRALWVHRHSRFILREYPLREAGGCLFLAEFPQQVKRFCADVYDAGLAVFWSGNIYALLRGVLKITLDRDRAGFPIYVRPLETA